MTSPTSALVILSGGQDSTTCLFWARERFDIVHALTFDYGQRHQREIEAARQVAYLAAVNSHEVLRLGNILKGRSPLVSADEQLETYTSAEQMEGVIGERVELTFVPGRNALFFIVAANRALCLDTHTLVTGVCQQDNANYPDCRAVFVSSMEKAVNDAMGTTNFQILAPLMDLTKAETVHLAHRTPGAYAALAYTHTAYSGEYPPITQDHATVLRASGFEQAGLPDPLIVRAWREGLIPALPPTPNYKSVV